MRIKSIVNHLVVGLNAVTKRLEEQVRKRPHSVTITSGGPAADTQTTNSDLCLVLACRADIDPPLLIDHLPHLISSCNAMQKESVRLASLPEGAEGILAKALGIRRVTVIGFDVCIITTAYLQVPDVYIRVDLRSWMGSRVFSNQYQFCPLHGYQRLGRAEI